MGPKDVTLRDIVSLMRSPNKDDIELVTKAHDFSREAHKDQKRIGGEAYFTHLLGTSYNLASLGMSSQTIAAGFLHDAIEDHEISQELIEKEFGPDILFLVEGVTKLRKLQYHGSERYVKSLQKLFIATSKDIRVVIIKLADRLHNMTTLHQVAKEQQERIATETLKIYAPLAFRLGIRKLSRTLENLCFPFVYPEEYKEVKSLLSQKKKETRESLGKFHNNLKKVLAENGYEKAQTDFRLKSLYSLYLKLLKKDGDINKVYDINAVRVMADNVEDCYKILGILHKQWKPLPGRIKDYISFPKPDGYQSIHTTLFIGDGKIVEVQIKTKEMYENVEYGITSTTSYNKEYRSQEERKRSLQWIEYLLPKKMTLTGEEVHDENIKVPKWIKDLVVYQKDQRDDIDAKDYQEELQSDFLKERIFVYTPLGDAIDLPVASTPVDFAYNIHSDIGDKMIAAKVNGKNCSFDTELKYGDIVEITTAKNEKPNIKWLEFTKTTLAQRAIRNYVERQSKKQS
jgi:GTP diphosphokinase / guanosine-3',5'-bis(diphosphate) 3'-diphosphatase